MGIINNLINHASKSGKSPSNRLTETIHLSVTPTQMEFLKMEAEKNCSTTLAIIRKSINVYMNIVKKTETDNKII